MLNILIFIITAYLILCLLLFILQDRLIFYPPKPVADVYSATRINEISYSSLGEQRHGWKISINPQARKTILYFGGNAEDVVYFNFEAEKFNARQAFAFNHPGYGKSEGQASQKNLYQNALDSYDYIVKEYQLKAEEIIVIGRSLGSSVATYLAASRDISRLVLITPFDSINNIAAQQYRMFPVSLLLKHHFPTMEYIAKVKKPVLMLAAEDDEIISEQHLMNLQSMAGSNARLIRYSGVGHNTIQNHQDYYNEINQFIF